MSTIAEPAGAALATSEAKRALPAWMARGADQKCLMAADDVDRLYRRTRASVLASVALGYGFLYTCRLPLSVIKGPLISAGLFDAETLGRVGASFAVGYAIGKAVGGALADFANVRRLFSLCVFLSAVVNLLMLGTQSAVAWAVLWFVNGWFQGSGAPCCGVSISNWFSIKERGRCYGIWSSSHSIGEGLTFVGTAVLVSHYGWRAGFMGPGIFCLIVAAALLVTMRDRPQAMGLPAVAEWQNEHASELRQVDAMAATPDSPVASKFAFLKMPAIWVLGLASASMYVTRYGVNSWAMLYLQEGRGYTLPQAGMMLGLSTTAGLVGCIAYGFLSDKLFAARRPPATLIFGLAEIVSLLLIFYTPGGHTYLLAAAFVLFGFTLSGLLAVLGGLFAIDIAGSKSTGTAMGFIGTLSYLGTAAQEWISGHLIGSGTTNLNGVKHYDFHTAVLFWIGASAASLLLASSLWFVKPKD